MAPPKSAPPKIKHQYQYKQKMSTELYKRHRPQSFKDLVGQEDAVKALAKMGKGGGIPHSLLFTGPSGCGKTTIARILQKKLKCHKGDFKEINASETRGIDMVRSIKDTMGLAPMNTGGVRIYLVDECHAMTKDAQNSFLKILEDTPEHVYFMLCTTDPQKLLATIKTRCTEIKVKALSQANADALIMDTAKKEGVTISEDVSEAIYEASIIDGGKLASSRKVMVVLNSIIGLDTEAEQLKAISQNDIKAAAFELCKVMIYNPRASWSDVSKVLSSIEEDPESIRYMVLGAANSLLLKGGKMSNRAYSVIVAFRDNFYDSKKAGLTAACYEVINGLAE